MRDNVYRFRSVKWGDPLQKLKMIPNDIGRSRWHMFLARLRDYGVVVTAFAVGIAGGFFLF